MAALALQANGLNPTGVSADRLIQAAHSTSDFPVLLQESGNRTLVSRFEQLVQDHRDLCVLGEYLISKSRKPPISALFRGWNANPRFIVCPVALETDTESLVSSLTYRLDLVGDQQTPQ